MALTKSKNFERYLKWYLKGSLSDEQLDELVETGLLTAAEAEEIRNAKNSGDSKAE